MRSVESSAKTMEEAISLGLEKLEASIADVTIDNWGEPGDAAFPIEGLDSTIGPTSSITGITIAQALVCQVVDNLVKAGIEPPVFKSSNVDGGDEHNNRMFDTYYGYWK